MAPAHAEPAAALRVLADEYWAASIERYPEIATYQGVTGAPHDRLTDNSLAAVAAWRAREDAWLARLRELAPQFDPASAEAVLVAILDDTLRSAVATRICRTELWSLSDAWPGWQGFLADWAAAQPVGDEATRRSRFRDFLARDYGPAARAASGVAALPDGERCYAASVRAYTTLEIPARTIHELGLSEMAKIEVEPGQARGRDRRVAAAGPELPDVPGRPAGRRGGRRHDRGVGRAAWRRDAGDRGYRAHPPRAVAAGRRRDRVRAVVGRAGPVGATGRRDRRGPAAPRAARRGRPGLLPGRQAPRRLLAGDAIGLNFVATEAAVMERHYDIAPDGRRFVVVRGLGKGTSDLVLADGVIARASRGGVR